MTHEPSVCALRPWGLEQGLALSFNQSAQQPAVFVTLGSISHSILVPQIHSLSRWTNLGGKQDLMPGVQDGTANRRCWPALCRNAASSVQPSW
jgi:hypothetical protein